MEWPGVLLRAGVPVTAAVVGGVAGAIGAQSRRQLVRPLISFAAGALLAIALLHLLPEAFTHAGWPALAAALLGGLLTMWLARLTGAACPACDGHEHRAFAIRLGAPSLLMLALHSILDGAALASTGHSHHSGEILSVAVIIHKLPEGLAIAALARAAGHSLPRAVLLTMAVQAFTFAGVGAAMALGHVAAPLFGIAMGLVGGSFLYLVSLALAQPGSTRLQDGLTAVTGGLIVLLARLSLG